MSDENFLSRWSRRKTEAKTSPAPAEEPRPAAPVEPPAVTPAQAATQVPAPLPPVESLTFESDFAAFMKPDVEAGLRRQALKTLLHDPRFNVMDGLDVYIDDYSKPDPLPDGWLEKMNQVKHLGIFKDPDEVVPDTPAASAEEAEKPIAEQAVEPAPAVEGSDTSGAQISPPQVGKSTPTREGDPDVLV